MQCIGLIFFLLITETTETVMVESGPEDIVSENRTSNLKGMRPNLFCELNQIKITDI